MDEAYYSALERVIHIEGDLNRLPEVMEVLGEQGYRLALHRHV